MDLAMLAMAPLHAAASMAVPLAAAPAPPPAAAPLPVARVDAPHSAEISVLTYNVKGLPWPVAKGRARALREIGEELAAMRRERRQPDVVLLQEGFRGEIAELVGASGYAYWAKGPDRAAQPAAGGARRRLASLRYALSGEGWGKLTGGGLHVLSDLPILEVKAAAYSACAGFDCLANKGVMLVSVALNDAPVEIDVVNTHLNSRRAAKAPVERTLAAHNRQMEELLAFVADNAGAGRPLLVGGDFNVRNAPERYYHKASARPFRVVSEYCRTTDPACAPPGEEAEPWLRSQDLQAFASPSDVQVRPIRVETAFDGARSPRLSDHDGYLVRYQLTWSPAERAQPQPARGLTVKPQFRNLGARVSWTY
ncbi:endonuclease/exonuclease/phosphatase family protein [Phenylobacterium sp.]|uniref:endonuclease/exonuclease/phosphatase family protein n=1 Tax=Phenylobacterium sp. TaxID=1871053 RepID=UPI0035B39659